VSITGVYETVPSADDVAAATAFYADVLGLRLVDGPDELAAAFRLDEGGVLLIFDRSLSSRPGRPAPSHGATGAGHIAFSVEAARRPLALGPRSGRPRGRTRRGELWPA
jgi:catechol 2,3-dioxygenase-like lactoylglutathione lyase family enzyme